MTARAEGYEAAVLFVIQMEQVQYLEPNDQTHAAFGQALRQAAEAGVQVLAIDCRIKPDEIVPGKPVKVRL